MLHLPNAPLIITLMPASDLFAGWKKAMTQQGRPDSAIPQNTSLGEVNHQTHESRGSQRNAIGD